MSADLSLEQAAAFIGLPEEQLRWWAVMGVGPNFTGNPYRPSSMFYDRQNLQEWLELAMTSSGLH